MKGLRSSRHLRLLVVVAAAIPVVISLGGATPTNAALDGLTKFEIDSNTVVDDPNLSDWVSQSENQHVALSNDRNFTGDPVVQDDVGSSSTEPSWLDNCVHSQTDTVFANGTTIDDPNWVDNHTTHSVAQKDDVCQSYFDYSVVQSGALAGHIISNVAFTRRVSKADGSYYFVLSKGENPDIRVDGDIVIEVRYGNNGDAESIATARWTGAGPTLGPFTDVGVDNPNVDLTPAGFFAEVAIDLTALGLVPNAFDLSTPANCIEFGFGRVISQQGGNGDLDDDGEPVGHGVNLCGTLVIQKQVTDVVPGATQFPVTVTAPAGVTVGDPNPVLTVPEGSTTSEPVTYAALPPRLPQDGGYNVWEDVTGDLAGRWVLDSILCVNDRGTESTDDDGPPTQITSPDDVFSLFAHETVTCTITNSPVPAVINVDKNAAGGVGTWQVVLRGPSPAQIAVSDDGTIDFTTPGSFATSGPTPAGVYVLTERSGAGAFRVGGWSCSVVGGGPPIEVNGASIGITVDPGDVVNCTIINTPVPPPDVEVIKSASPTSFREPATAGDEPIVYTVEVLNSGDEPFTIESLTDSVGLDPAFDLDAAVTGDEAGMAGATIVANDCVDLVDEEVDPNGSDSCRFSVSYADRDAGDQVVDVVTAFVEDAFGQTASASDDETVTVDDVAPTVLVEKQNIPVAGTNEVVAPGGLATYSVDIRNPATAVEPFTITSVIDTISTTGSGFGPTVIDYFTAGGPVVATDCTDLVSTVLGPDEFVTCEFTIDTRLLGSGVVAEGDQLTNRVDVVVVDDDATTDDGFDDADRDVVGEAPQLFVDKTDHDVDILEAADDIAYDITITNISLTEPLTIRSITDEITFLPADGAPESRGVLVVDQDGIDTSGLVGVTLVSTDCDLTIDTPLDPNGDSTECTITLRLTGNADDRYEDKVTVLAVDDEDLSATASSEADTPVVNVAPDIAIVNDAAPASVPETGGEVVYTLTVTNDSFVSGDPVTITELSDSVFGSFFPVDTLTGVLDTDCFDLEDVVLQLPGDSASCSITAFLSGQAADAHVDNANVAGIGEEGSRASADDAAMVLFEDVIPAIFVTKTADQSSVDESGELVTFTVTVENDTLEPLTIDALDDDVYGDLIQLAESTCVAGVELEPDDDVVGSGNGTGPDTYTCTFTVLVAQVAAELQHKDTVTVAAHDNDGNAREAGDDEIISFDLIAPTVQLTKQDQPDGNATVDEPGGDVPYTITITNASAEPVTITRLAETTVYESPAVATDYNLLSPALPISDVECTADLSDVIAPHQTVTCRFVVTLAGNAQIVSDRVDVLVTDDDGQVGGDVAEASVPILDVRPAIAIVKASDPAVISAGDEVTYRLTITNLSTVEGVRLLTLTDDRFGNVLPECEQFGMARTLGPGASTTCEFARALDEAPDTTHTNIVTVSGADDETLVNLAVAREFQDDSVLPVTATSQISVLTVGPDLELTKSDAGFVATAGQQMPFPFTITVTNVGEGEVSVEDSVTVVDDLPGAFRWVAPPPAGCTLNGQRLTCSIAASGLRPAGTEATIVASARPAPGAVAGTFDNRAYVTTPDDPVTTPPPCTDTEAVAADNNVDCEPTPVVSSITITALASECVNDAPYITYDIAPFGFTPTGGATLTFYDLDGNLVESMHVTELTGRVLYPGAAADSAGNGTDWPGWKFENGQWVVDPSDARLRDGLRVVVEVNPIAAGIVTYPSATSACADPTQVPPTALPPAALPPTGSNSARPAAFAALGLVVVGGLVLLVSRRRSRISSSLRHRRRVVRRLGW